MCRSSRILAFVCIAAATPAFGQARVGINPAAGHAFAGVPRAAIQPGIRPGIHSGVNPNVRTGIAPGVRPNIYPNVRSGVQPGRGVLPGLNSGLRAGAFRPGLGRYGRRRFGGTDLGFAGLGLSLLDGLPYAPAFDGGYDGGAPDPAVIPAVDPPACVRPLVIRVGKGLRRVAKTRVIYGSPPGCGEAYQR